MVDNRRSDDTELYQRVSHVEAEIVGIKTSIHSQTEKIDGLATSINQLVKDRETNWGTIAAIAGVLLVIIGMYSAGYIRDLERNEGSIREIIKAQVEHSLIDGHPMTVALAKSNKEDLKTLDETLQREMRLLNSETQGRIEALDKLLQREMRDLNDTQNKTIDNASKEIDRIRDWQERHDHRVMGINASQTARLNAIEREVFKK